MPAVMSLSERRFEERRSALRLVALAALSLGSARAWSEDEKANITLLVGASAGMDVAARVVAAQLGNVLGRSVVPLSRLGAGQRLALGEVRRAAPDGRTLCFATSGPFVIYPHIYTKLDYDPDRDFTPIAGVSTFDVALATGPMTGVSDMKQLVEWVQARKGDAVFGSAPGNGSLSHFVGISVNLATGLAMTHVPYKDSGVGLVDLATGRLPIMITGLSGQFALHRSGKIRVLAVSGEKRSPQLPDVPTLKEAGINVSATTSTGLFGPAGMPAALVSRLHAAVQPIFSDGAVLEKLALQGQSPLPITGAQFAAAMVEERKRLEAIVKASGMVPEAA